MNEKPTREHDFRPGLERPGAESGGCRCGPVDRREFIKLAGAGAASLSAGGTRPAIAGPFEPKAVADHFDPRARSVGALEAGVDALLVCSEADLREEILRHLERAPDTALEHGLRRMVEFKRSYGGGRAKSRDAQPPYAEHRALAEGF